MRFIRLGSGRTKITGMMPVSQIGGLQTSLDDKAPIASPTFTGVVTIPTPFTLGSISVTTTGDELNYVNGVTSSIQTQLNTKAPLASPTFTGTVTLPVGLTGVIRTDVGVVSIDTDVTDLVDNLSYTKLADGTDGELITWSATGAPATVAVGTAGHVLTSNGVGAAPTFQVGGGGIPTQITVADESADTTCFIAFFTAATGDLGPKTASGLTFNSSTDTLTATAFVGPLTGNASDIDSNTHYLFNQIFA